MDLSLSDNFCDDCSRIIIKSFPDLDKPLSARFKLDGKEYLLIDARLSESEKNAVIDELMKGEIDVVRISGV